VWLLIDQSASTAAAHGRASVGMPRSSVLQTAAQAAAALALALQAAGVPCALAGFSSYGRHEVRLQVVKPLDAPVDAGVLARLNALRPAGSTRLGAALRQAGARLAGARSGGAGGGSEGRTGGARWVLLLSDGQPHDIDVHDPKYLVDDARHAVRSAARNGVRVVCLSLAAADSEAHRDALRIFGRHAMHPLDELPGLPRGMARLLA
jgi:nitric oxide reductase activation protein